MTAPVPGVIPLTNPVPQQLRRFDKYYLVQKIAEGGMAEIFLAKQVGAEGFERDVVVKCMLEHFSSSPDFVEMFLDEARVAARLFHPNIVQITDLGTSDGRYFLCMEYLPGEDVQSLIEKSTERGEPVPLGVAARIILSALEGLEYAHTFTENGQPANLVHRDVSPSNIFVTFQGTVKVLDFGIAKASSKLKHTQPGTVKGKLGYMAPEQARGEAIDARADVFSLGVTLHELLTGRRVFQKDNEVGILIAMMQEQVPAPSTVRPEIPRALDNIVLRACERDPNKRYGSAAEMRHDIEHFLSSHLSAPGTSQLSAFMQRLFGPEQVKRRTQIPTLKDLMSRGFVLPAEPSKTASSDGFDKTFVRGAAEAVSPRHQVTDVIAREKPPPPVPDAPKRGRGLVIGLSTVALLAIAGAGAVVTGVVPGLGKTPPPPPPLDVVAPPDGPDTTTAVTAQDPVTDTTSDTSDTSDTADTAATDPDPVNVGPGEGPGEVKPDKTPIADKRPVKRVELTSADITKILARRLNALNRCAQKFQGDVPAGGKVEMILLIEPSGKVSSAAPVDTALAGTKLNRCLASTLRSVPFPPNTSNGIRFKLPMKLEQAQ